MIVKSIIAVLCAIASFIVGYGDRNMAVDYCVPVTTEEFMLFEAYTHGQGVTNDGKYFYFSCNTGITKTELDGHTVVKQKLLAIPADLMMKGCKHIGGISCMNGIIYAPIEDSKVFENLYIAEYDCETLSLIDYHKLPCDKQENGAPWCVADKENNLIYSARRDYAETINAYDPETFELVKEIPINTAVHKIQGGEMYNGILYLSVSRDGQPIYAVNLKTGEVKLAFKRNLPDKSEGEGMTILPMDDGTLFHVLDIANIRIGVHLRNYAFNPSLIDWKAE